MHNGPLLRPPAVFGPPAARRGPGGAACAVLALIGCWSLLVGARTQILSLLPAAAPVYAALGLQSFARPMRFESVVSRLTEEDGRLILVIEGEIRNLADGPRTAPRVKLAVLDAAGQEIYHWTAAPPQSRLRAGETAFFRARLATPPPGGSEVRLRFAGASDAMGRGS
jgi:hypothetical protein